MASINIAANGNGDWPKETIDFLTLDGARVVETADELREVLLANGESVEHFKSLPSWPAMLGRNPWLRGL